MMQAGERQAIMQIAEGKLFSPAANNQYVYMQSLTGQSS